MTYKFEFFLVIWLCFFGLLYWTPRFLH